MMLGKFGETIRGKRKEKKGFTLLELIIVIAIIAILLALLVPNLSKVLKKASSTAGNANAKTAYTSASTWAAELATDNVPVVDATITITNGAVSSVTPASFSLTTAQKESLEKYINTKKGTIVILLKDDYSITSATCDGVVYPTT